jgi:hypothetical protein
MAVTIKIKNYQMAEAYCLKHIGPRLFYIHNKVGGQGWIIKRIESGYSLTIEDKGKSLFAILQLSDNIL